MQPQGEAYNVEWFFSSNSNAHVAKDSEWSDIYN